MNSIYQELSKTVESEYDYLIKMDNPSDQCTKPDMDKSESLSLMQLAPNDIKPVVIQIEAEHSLETPVVAPMRIRFPIAITLISLLELLLYMYDSNTRKNGKFSPSAQNLLFSSDIKIEFWRFITYMLVHQDNYHLGLNVFLQLVGGVPLEIGHGWWRVTIIYMAGVLGGSLGVESISSCTALVGASAGLYSILGAHFSTLILNWKKTEDRAVRIFILTIIVLTEIFNWICIPQIARNPEFGSSTCVLVSELTNTTITHVSGFIIGSLTALVILKVSNPLSWTRTIRIVSLILLVFIISFAICLIAFAPEFDLKSLIETLECDKNLTGDDLKDSMVKCQKLV